MKLSSLVDVVRTTDEEIVITKNGYPAAVLVSPDEFEGWRETLAIHDDSDLLAEIKKKDWQHSIKNRLRSIQLKNFLTNNPVGRSDDSVTPDRVEVRRHLGAGPSPN